MNGDDLESPHPASREALRSAPGDIEPVAWLHDRWLPASEAALPLHDLGLQGMAVTETVRTFGHVLCLHSVVTGREDGAS